MSNLTWEHELRRRYAASLTAFVIFIAFLTIMWGIYKVYSLEKTILLFVSLLPVFGWGIPNIIENFKTAKRIEYLKIMTDQLWSKAFISNGSELELTRSSREIQDLIYENRKNAPLVFDLFYWLFRNRDNSVMNAGSEDLARKALHAKNKKKDGDH